MRRTVTQSRFTTGTDTENSVGGWARAQPLTELDCDRRDAAASGSTRGDRANKWQCNGASEDMDTIPAGGGTGGDQGQTWQGLGLVVARAVGGIHLQLTKKWKN